MRPKQKKIDCEQRTQIIKRTAIIAVFANSIMSGIKIVSGFLSGSLAVIGDGIDSAVDVFIDIMSIFVARIISKPADLEHPWGHKKAETIATAIISFVLFFIGAQLIISSIEDIFSGLNRDAPGIIAIVATVISIVGKTLLALLYFVASKKANSTMLLASSKNMNADVILSVGVLVGLGLSIFFNTGTIDSIFAILIGLWIIKTAIGIFLGVTSELMDGGSDKSTYAEVFEAIKSVSDAKNPHKLRIRKIAGYLEIDVHIEVSPEISVVEAHKISQNVEKAIKERIENVYDITTHIEPSGNREDEGYGLCEKTLKTEINTKTN